MQSQPKPHLVKKPIAFIDLKAQQLKIRGQIEAAIQRVLDHGCYIMGPDIEELELALAAFCGAKHALSCANGTDALALVLMAKKVGPGDAVLVPTFTFAATAEVVAWVGATPIFVDVLPDTFNIDPLSLKEGIQQAHKQGLNPCAVIAVDLFGQPADYGAIEKICQDNGLWLLTDAAQSFGATYHGANVGTFGLATTTSFFPAKPLGCYGDGGAIFTDNDDLADLIRSLRVHGQGKDKYDNVLIGMNGRMDTLQAAILKEKLSLFPHEIRARQRLAERYHQGLNNIVQTPFIPDGLQSVWAQYTIVLKQGQREPLIAALKAHDIPTAIYYPKSLHQQPAYQPYPRVQSLAVAESLGSQVLSLPMHPYLEEESQDQIIEVMQFSLKK